jgi:hypothetical protein
MSPSSLIRQSLVYTTLNQGVFLNLDFLNLDNRTQTDDFRCLVFFWAVDINSQQYGEIGTD